MAFFYYKSFANLSYNRNRVAHFTKRLINCTTTGCRGGSPNMSTPYPKSAGGQISRRIKLIFKKFLTKILNLDVLCVKQLVMYIIYFTILYELAVQFNLLNSDFFSKLRQGKCISSFKVFILCSQRGWLVQGTTLDPTSGAWDCLSSRWQSDSIPYHHLIQRT